MIDFDSAPGSGSNNSQQPRVVTPYQAPDVDVGNLLKALNEKQREAVLITEGPLMVLAGAGSGKTKMLTSRISYLIAGMGVQPHQILAMTFTNKAAAEMRGRVEKTLNLAEGQLTSRGFSFLGVPEIGTFHSVCVRLLRRELERTPFTKQFVIYDDSDQLSLIKSTLEKLSIDDKAFSPKGMQAAINRLKCDAVEPQDVEVEAHNVFQKNLKKVYEQYQKDLFSNNALDFGEIICMPYRILRDHEDIRLKYQKRFQYIHVDEYQDTNRAQYALLSMLAGKTKGGHTNICVVGDEDQSIYKWRGADIRNIMDFESDFPGAQVVKLEQNYRSTKTIIQAATQVIKNNKYRKDKTLWTDNEEGVQIIHSQLADERAEAEQVVGEIKRIAQNEGRTYNEFSIFYRTNAQSRQFEDFFRRDKITYQIVGGLRFYDRKEIKDVLSYMKIVLNPSDSVGLKRIINVPARGIGKTTIEKLEQYHQVESANNPLLTFWDVLNLAVSDTSIVSAAVSKKLAGFVALMQRLMDEQPKLLVSELYHLILDETGYVRDLRKEATEEAADRIENLEEFDNVLKEFEEDQLTNVETDAAMVTRKSELLPQFIEQSALMSEADKKDPNITSVKMMTLHSSKGLEFPVVFLVGLEEGLFPSIKSWEETPEEDVEEERRLCYVGMTRAREQLYMSNVLVRRVWGNVNYQEPSRFLKEIPPEFIEFRDLSKAARPGYSSDYSGYQSGGYGSQPVSKSGYGSSLSSNSSGNSSGSSGSSSYTPRPGMPTNPYTGRRVNHPEYGSGVVLALEGSGADQKVVIEFRGRDQRKFLLRYVATFFE
jgi:DNA helicase II / ATP-dependent DNA helicase PcrA